MATYYVATTGNNANPGTSGSPKRNVRHGVALASAGDTVVIGPGTYTSADDVIDSDTSLGYTVPSGTSFSNAVTIQGDAVTGTTLQPPDGTHACRLTNSDHHIIIRDLIFDYTNDTTDREGIYVSGSSHHIRIQDVEVKNCSNFGVVFAAGSTGFNELLTSQIHDCGDPSGTNNIRGHGLYFSCPDNLIQQCLIWNNEGYGVHLYSDDPSRNRVIRCRIWANGAAGHSAEYAVLAATGTDIEISNNIIYENHGGIWVASTSTTTKVYNNTVANNTDEGIRYESPNATIKNNISYGNTPDLSDGPGHPGAGATLSNNLTGGSITPATDFVDATLHNFRLTAGSAARNAGATVSAVTTDYDGNARPQESVYDVGAFEYVVAAGAAPNHTRLHRWRFRRKA